jgi:hypothetical protein
LLALEEAVAATSDCRLVVIDPISAYCRKADSHKNADIRGLLGPLAELAQRAHVAVFAVTHLNKGGGKAKGKPAGGKTRDRFAVLNAFVDFTLAELTRNEIAVWLVLYRDTKPDGTARTSQADLARRAGTSDRSIRRALTAGPYIIYRNVADFLACAITRDRVWIVEENHAIFAGMIPSPIPMVDGHRKNCPIQRYYACVRSVREAEDWLLQHGYKKAPIYTEHLPESDPQKEFFIRHVPGTKAYSVVALMIDYGDYDIRLVPYHYARGKSPVDFSRFQEEDWTETGGGGNTLPMPWISTDGYGSHTFGGRAPYSNHEEVGQYDWDRYVEAVMGR